MAMFSDCNCESRGNTYRFSSRSLSFRGASTACTDDGGRLARFLTRSDYEELNSCCSLGRSYWIGLVEREGCSENAPYRWDTTSGCRNAAPLIVTNQRNFIDCQGVVIRTTGGKVLPIAGEEYCFQFHRFICQYLPPLTTATSATKTSISSITRKSASFSSTQLSSVTSSFPNSSNASTDTMANSTQSKLNAAIISSIILGSIILCLLLATFCYWRYKKSESAQMKSSSATSEPRISSLVQFKQTHTSSNTYQEHLRQNVHSSHAASQLYLSTSQTSSYASPNIQPFPNSFHNAIDAGPNAIKTMAVTREYENDLHFHINSDSSGYVAMDSKATYLRLDNPDNQGVNDNNDFHSSQQAEDEMDETVYLKPFN